MDDRKRPAEEVGRETSDWSIRVVVVSTFILFSMLAAVLIAAAVTIRVLDRFFPPEQSAVVADGDYPAPQLRDHPYEGLEEYDAAQQKLLSEYRWIDRDRGVVAIPIERAMEIVAWPEGEGQ
jgi:hypothetical protein